MLVEPGERVLQVSLVERAVLPDEGPHHTGARPRLPGAALAARRAPLVVSEHLRHALGLPAARHGAEPEVPVLGGVDETWVVPTHRIPRGPAVERADVDRAADEQLLERERARAPGAVMAADEANPA